MGHTIANTFLSGGDARVWLILLNYSLPPISAQLYKRGAHSLLLALAIVARKVWLVVNVTGVHKLCLLVSKEALPSCKVMAGCSSSLFAYLLLNCANASQA
jgi:hypothetical protein